MRRLATLSLLLLAHALHANNPDGHGYFQAGGRIRLSAPSEKGRFRLGASTYEAEFAEKEGVQFMAGAVYPVADALSLSGFWASGSERMEYSERVLNSGSSSALIGLKRTHQYAGGGLRFYPGAWFRGSYDPLTEENPEGFLGWPSFTFALSFHDGEEGISSTWTAVQNNAPLVTEHRMDTSFGLIVPWSMNNALTLGYARQHSRQASFASLAVPWSRVAVNDDGAGETLSGTLSYVLHTAPKPLTGPVAYLPHVGLPGTVRVDLNFTQDYDLALGKLSSRDYRMDATWAFERGLGLTLSYAFNEDLRSYLPVDAEITGSDHWGQVVGLSLSYGFGRWALRGNEKPSTSGADPE